MNLPSESPLSADQRVALDSALVSMNEFQRGWLSGWLAGSANTQGTAAPAPPQQGTSKTPVTILYGTESGNAEALADVTAKKLKKEGCAPKVKNMADLKVDDLNPQTPHLVIVSTWGEGDPPESAEPFYQELMASKASLAGLKYSVCALGDTSYEKFCQTGKDVDAQLAKLGGEELVPRVDCDVDYDEAHSGWLEQVAQALKATAVVGQAPTAMPAGGTAAQAATPATYGKKNPFPAPMLERVLLNGPGSQKETWHYELSLEGSGLAYEAGDALGVIAQNDPAMVDALLKLTGCSGSEMVELKGAGQLQLKEALTSRLDVTALSKAVAKKILERTGSKKLEKLLSKGAEQDWKDYLWGRQVIDLLEDFGGKELSAGDLVACLRALPPRLYSIASSPKAHEGEVHLTVASVRYHSHGRDRKGVASTWLADQAEVDAVVPAFVQPNKRFRLPSDPSRPIIMVGPGTGVAPFRAFVEERAETGADGKSWLFFGDQHYTHDFLYQLEWQDHLKNGALSRLDVAFSRDQPEKIYVQDRLREQGKEVYGWLQDGGHFYVCGDASRMAGDVHQALVDIFAKYGKVSQQEASEQLEQMKKDGRYQRDVY